MGSCRAPPRCERLGENQPMAIGIAGSQDPPSVAITDERGREPRNQLDLATAQLGESRRPTGDRKVGTS